MDRTQFDTLVAAARARQDSLLAAKGADYTRHDPDRLASFKRLAKELGVDPRIVWAVYAGKHWDAIVAYVKTGRAESEALQGRLDDLANYLHLLEGLVTEGELPYADR